MADTVTLPCPTTLALWRSRDRATRSNLAAFTTETIDVAEILPPS